MSELWSNSSIKWEMLLNNDENVDKFVKEKVSRFKIKLFSLFQKLTVLTIHKFLHKYS